MRKFCENCKRWKHFNVNLCENCYTILEEEPKKLISKFLECLGAFIQMKEMYTIHPDVIESLKNQYKKWETIKNG